MLAWIILLILIVADIVAVRWWLASRIYPVFFNDWAAFLYSLVLAIDILLAWVVSTFSTPGGTPGMQILLAAGVAFAFIVGLGTLFFRWVIHLDMTDSSKRDR